MISVMQMVAGTRHRSHHFSVSSEELEQMEAEINHELASAAEEEEDENRGG